MLIRCNHVRNETCETGLGTAFCNKGLNEIYALRRPDAELGRSTLRCSHVGHLRPLPGWLVADSKDTRAIKWFHEELTARRLRAVDVDLTLVEYVIPVTVD